MWIIILEKPKEIRLVFCKSINEVIKKDNTKQYREFDTIGNALMAIEEILKE